MTARPTCNTRRAKGFVFLKFIEIKKNSFEALPTLSRQPEYIPLADLWENDRAFLFLLDPARRQRIKIWGRARMIENDPALIEQLFDSGYKAKLRRADVLAVGSVGRELLLPHRHAIHRGRDRGDVAAVQARIAQLETENARCAGPSKSNRQRRRMNHDSYPDIYIRGILNTVKTIAMVGISPRPIGRAISPSSTCSSAATK